MSTPKKDPYIALRYKEFRAYVLARFLITIAVTMQAIIIGYEIYELTNSKLLLGFIGLAEAIPAIGNALYGGYIADKSDKRTMLVMFVGIYTILGVQKSLELGVNPFAAVILGLVSAVFGGVIRDTLLNEIPLIFAKEIYATACIAGAVLYTSLLYFNIETNLAASLCMSIIIIIRIIAVKYKLALPKFDMGNETID